MATKESKYVISFDVNTSQLTKAFDKIRQLTTHDLMDINPNINTDQANKQINELWKQTSALETAFEKAFNPKLNTVNIQTFNKSLKDSGTSLQKVYNEYKKAGSAGEGAFRAMSSKLLDTNIKLKETSGLFKEIGTTLKNSIKWNIASSVINTFSGKVQEAYGYVKNLDSSLNDIRIVTGKSAEEMDKFAEKANKAAQNLGKSTTDYTKASLIYYQQGLSDEESAARADVTLKAANVTQQSTQEVSEQLTAVWNGYKVSAQEAELYVDKLAAVAAGTASDLEELSTGMSKVASAANALGVDVDQMNAILSTSISVTRQAPETIGSAYKTIFARMSTISAGGIDEEDGATLTSYTEKMNKLGVNVLDANNQLRDMGDVVEEVGGKWNTFSKEQQIALAQVMAGTRQYNNLIALFDNWDKYTEALNMSANAAGTLNKQNEIYMESTQAKLQSLSTAVEGIFDSLLSSKDIGKVADTLVPIANGIESVIDAVGGGTNILAMFGPAILRSFSPEISKQILTFKHNIEAVTQNKAQLDNYIQTLQTLTSIKVVGGADQDLQNYQRILASMAQYMKPEEYQDMINKVNELTQSYNQQGEIIEQLNSVYNELSKTLNKPIDENNYQKEVEGLQADLNKLGAAIYDIGQQSIVIPELSDNQIKQKLDSIRNKCKNVKVDFNNLSTEIKDFSKIKLNNVEQNLLQSFLSMKSGVSKLQASFDGLKNTVSQDVFSKVGQQLQSLQQKLRDGVFTNDMVNQYHNVVNTIIEEIERLQGVADKSDDTIDKIKQLQKILGEVKAQKINIEANISDKQIEKATQGVVQLGTSLLQLAATATTFADSWKNIWDDDNLSEMDKFKKSLQLIAFSGVSLLNMASGAVKSFKNLTGVFKTNTAHSLANAGANKLQADSQKDVAASAKLAEEQEKKTAAADKIEGDRSAQNTIDNLAQAGAQKVVAGASSGAAKIGGAAVTGASTAAATGAGAAVAGGGAAAAGGIGAVTASLAPMIAIAGVALVAIVGLSVAFYKAYQESIKYDKAIREATKAHEEAKEVLSQVTTQYNNIVTAIDSLKEKQEVLDSMTEGSTEWKEQLKEVNTEIETLLENFPELKKYATFSNGQWSIKEEDLDQFKQEAEQRKNFQQQVVLGTEINVAQAEYDKVFGKLSNDLQSFIQTNFDSSKEGAKSSTKEAYASIPQYLQNDIQKNQDDLKEYIQILSKKQKEDEENWANGGMGISDDTLNEIVSQFTAFGDTSNVSYEVAISYLERLIELQEATNEFNKTIADNTRAMLDSQYGSEITEGLTEAGITDEKQQNIIKNAVEYSTAQHIEKIKNDNKELYFTDKGELRSDLSHEQQQAITEFVKQYYAAEKSTDDKTYTPDDITLDGYEHVSIDGNEETIDWSKLSDLFLNWQATQNTNEGIQEYLKYYQSNIPEATMVAVANGLTDINTLTKSEIQAIKDLDSVNEQNLDSYNKFTNDVLKEYETNQSDILNNITSNAAKVGYHKITSTQDLTGEQSKKLADKFNKIADEFGSEGVKNFINQIQDQPISTILEFDTNSLSSELSLATQKALEDAKIDQSVFKNYKENYEAMGFEYDDDTIIRYIQAEEDLNKIYEDRKDIFKSLANAEEGNFDQTQLGYINQIQSALSKLTGFDLTADQIINNLDAIQSYLTGTKEGAEDLQQALAQIKVDEVNNIFKSADTEIGMPVAQIVTNKVNELQKELQLSEEQVRAIYATYGYFYDDEKQQYVKLTPAIDKIAMEVEYGYKKGSTQEESKLMEQLGVQSTDELRELGWTPHYTPNGTYWEKTESFVDKITSQGYYIGDDGQLYEILEDIGDLTDEQLKTEGYELKNISGKDKWVKPIDLETWFTNTIASTQVGQYSPPAEDASKNKVSGSEKKYKRKYENVTDFYDQVISAKQRELKALQDAEENLTGDALTNNLNKQKELYEQIVEKQKEKLKLSEDDIKLQKEQLDKTASDAGVSVEYDDSGYVSNIGNILDTLDKDAKDKADIYDAEYKRLKDKEDNKQSISQDEIDNLEKLSKAADEAEKKLTDFKESYDDYISALGNKDKVIDDIIETQNNIDDTRISSYLAATNKEFERLSTEASNFASAMSDAAAQFQKLSGDEQIDNLHEWMNLAHTLKEVYKTQQDVFKEGLDDITRLAQDADSGLDSKDKEVIESRINTIKSSKDTLLDVPQYLSLFAYAEKKVAEAQKELDEAMDKGDKAGIEKATAKKNTYKAIAQEAENAAKEAQALAKNLDEIYLTAGEVKDQFVDWQISAIDTQIGLIDKKISRLQKKAGKLKGQALIDNLKQQNQQIEKQIKLEKGKLKILQAQMKIKKILLQQSLSELAAALGTQLSLSFDNLGNITAESIANMEKAVTASLKGAGAMGAAAQQQWNALLQAMEAYNASAAAVQASMDAIEGYGDSMQDNLDAMNDALKEARNLALEIFNAKVDVEINIEDAWRQFDALKAKMDGIKENNFLAQAELSAKNIQRYLGDISNPNSYFGSGKGSIGILTDHLNDIMSEISIMQSGGTSQYYGNDEGAAFDDLMNYANQLMSQVEAYYQELENVRQQYSNVIDAIISKNKELLDDYDKMSQLSKHGINITKLLYGEESYDKLSKYYTNISKNTKEMLKQAADSKQYYAEQMKRLQAQGDTDTEAYQKMREGYEESMQQVYEYGEQLLEQYSEELMNKVNSYQQKMTDTLANLAGFADKLLMDQDWEHQTKLMDDYLDATNAAYEMQALQSKFQSSIDDTDNLAGKKELTKVMNEQLGILEKQLEDGQMLTQYDIDRANKVYELTLKQIALEEAQQNKSKMRLRRDSQGNYRYEYVADQQKIEDARQELLKAQNDLYNLDKKRTVEMINEIQTLQSDYYAKQKAILEDSYLSEEEKKQALADLEMKYYGQPNGLIYMAVQEYAQAKENMESMTDEKITFYHNTMAEAMTQNWNEIAAAENANTQQILSDLDEQAAKVQEATDLMTQGYGSLDDAIKQDIVSMENLLRLDEELLNKYEEEMLAIEDLMKELEELEDHYKAVLDAAMAAIEAALQLRQMKWDKDDGKSDKSSSSNSNSGGGSSSGGGGGGGTIQSRTATIKYEIEEADNGKQNAKILSESRYSGDEITKIHAAAGNNRYNWVSSLSGKTSTRNIAFDTGGYTGSWGKEGKIAMLHEKELVLNKTDTKNMLDTVNIVRQLGSSLSAIKDTFGAKLTKYSDTMNSNVNSMVIDKTSTQKLDQNVKIEANFPNVKNANEIETAFNNLVNLASQRAMSTRR